MFLGLRQLDGIDLDAVQKRYQRPIRPRIEPLLKRGLLQMQGERLRLSPQSLTVSNEVFAALLD
jgi:coproporphyrinogen III oxidase-like Fe-S oxidoreductase